MIKGIDISAWQGVISADQFKHIKSDGIQFAILRAGVGKVASQKDKVFEQNYINAKNAGLAVGCYHYTYAVSVAEAQQEASVFLEWIKGKQFEYPIYFDIEDKSIQGLDKKLLTDITLTWCGKVQSAGYYVGVYANPDWFTNKLDLSRLTGFDKWLAHYVDKPKWGSEFGGMWQYGYTRVKGYNADIDGNISYRDYPAIIKSLGLNGFAKSAPTKSTIEISTVVNGKTYKGILTEV